MMESFGSRARPKFAMESFGIHARPKFAMKQLGRRARPKVELTFALGEAERKSFR